MWPEIAVTSHGEARNSVTLHPWCVDDVVDDAIGWYWSILHHQYCTLLVWRGHWGAEQTDRGNRLWTMMDTCLGNLLKVCSNQKQMCKRFEQLLHQLREVIATIIWNVCSAWLILRRANVKPTVRSTMHSLESLNVKRQNPNWQSGKWYLMSTLNGGITLWMICPFLIIPNVFVPWDPAVPFI